MTQDRRTPSDLFTRNVLAYPWYLGLQRAFFWMPVFFLYFSQRVSLQHVLWLEAIYYLTIVLVEVPSGYLSDRFGRRRTLLVSSIALFASYLCFAFAPGFTMLAIAQMLLAMGFASGSGTDTSFHLDSLVACDREDELGDREARVSGLSFLSAASAAAVGGVVATVASMSWVYLLSAAATLATIVIAWRFVEPPAHSDTSASERFVTQLRDCLLLARSPTLRWLLACAVLAIVLNHVPYELYQPYLDALVIIDSPKTPLVAGLHMAAASAIATVFGAKSVALSRHLGLRATLIASLAMQWLLIVAMAAWVHPVIALLLVTRGIPGALQQAPLNAAIAPQVPSHQRATLLSIKSLVGRLGFALLLLALSLLPHEVLGAGLQEVQTLALWAAALTFTGVLAVAIAGRSRD